MPGYWDSESVLGDLPKGNERIRVREVRRRDATMVDIRLFWQDKDEKWQPSKRGVSIPVTCVGPLINVLQRVSTGQPLHRKADPSNGGLSAPHEQSS
jgi:hypothetical protein